MGAVREPALCNTSEFQFVTGRKVVVGRRAIVEHVGTFLCRS